VSGDGILWLCFDGDLHFHTHFQTDIGTILGGETVLDANLLIKGICRFDRAFSGTPG